MTLAKTAMLSCLRQIMVGSVSFHILTFTTLWANSADNEFFLLSKKIDFDISRKLSPEEFFLFEF